VGYSDHTIGSTAAVGAVCFGATVIEKHFTLDKNMAGPDHWFASDTSDLNQYISDIRSIENCIGISYLIPSVKEIGMRDLARRKIIASKNIEKGEVLTINDYDFKRAEGDGLPPKYIHFLLNRKLKVSKKINEVFTINDFE